MTTHDEAVIETDKPLFIGLKAYTEEQAAIFFGRSQEIKTLFKLIKANTITIVFGKSGTGKTSLLNAGVFPKLREIYCLPFRIRLEFLDNSPDLITQIKQVLKTEIDKYEFHVYSYPGKETLWEYFHKEPLWKIVTPVLIFDQFEEIFTLAAKSSRFKKEELDRLIEELSDLVENSIPEKLKDEYINGNEDLDFDYEKQKVKIIFSFREDFLAEIESITLKIPSVKNSRFRLMPMHGRQAYEVITKTWKNSIDPAEANKIVYFLTNETETDSIDVENKYGKYDIIEVEPSLLSQVCSSIEKERIEEGSEKISADFLKHHSKDQILRGLYNQALNESDWLITSAQSKTSQAGNRLREFIEDHLITDEGYRTKYAIKEIDEKIKPGIQLLEKKYLLREEGNSIELTHDVIVTLVKSDREERRKKVALAKERRKAKKKMRAIIAIVAALMVLAGFAINYFITKEAKKERKEAFAQRDQANAQKNRILVKNESLRTDSLKLEHFLNQKNTAANDTVAEIHLKVLSDSITNLNGAITTMQNDYTNTSKVYKDSINHLGLIAVNYQQNEKDLKDSIHNLIKSSLDNKNSAFENKEKGYLLRINLLQQQVAVLQQNRDSLAALIARSTDNKRGFTNNPPSAQNKKKIFGYGYDYHVFKKK